MNNEPTTEKDRSRPPLFGSLGYLLLNLPIGIAGFVAIVALGSVGATTLIIWIGIPVLALLLVSVRAAARIERARVYSMLGAYVPLPYRTLPDGDQKARWKARIADQSTWRDMTYFVLLFPIGIAQFTIMAVSWALSLGLIGLPIYYRFLPEGAYFFPSFDLRWITVDSEVSALPWAALGLLCLALTIAITKALASAHAGFARLMLGPTPRQMREADNYVPFTPTVRASGPAAES
ncbi:sensor domain-containing protein [Saccharomonospora sp. NPDC006951]